MRRMWLVVPLGCLIVGCGDDAKSTCTGTAALVGPLGGTIQACSGTSAATLQIPPGALEDSVEIQLSPASSNELATAPNTFGLVRAWVAKPHGLTFRAPAVLTVGSPAPESGHMLLAGRLDTADDSEWDILAPARTTTTPAGLVVLIDTFSVYGVFSSPDGDGDGTPDSLDEFPTDASETTDTDGDGRGDNGDTAPGIPELCGDSDDDTCEDCANGSYQPDNDGDDRNSDGMCDACDATRCNNQGHCDPVTKGCVCQEAWEGPECNLNRDGCAEADGEDGNPCNNLEDALATCFDIPAPFWGYNCACSNGYVNEGGVCVEIDECFGNPCDDHGDHAASCEDGLASYTCHCSPGYDGTTGSCRNIDECAGNPCDDQGDVAATCTDGILSFTCGCSSGFLAANGTCENIDECLDTPCNNAGDTQAVCVDTPGSYTCTCSAGYYGSSCAPCPGGALNVCSGNGTCDEGASGSGICTCADTYHGDACQYQCGDSVVEGGEVCDQDGEYFYCVDCFDTAVLRAWTGTDFSGEASYFSADEWASITPFIPAFGPASYVYQSFELAKGYNWVLRDAEVYGYDPFEYDPYSGMATQVDQIEHTVPHPSGYDNRRIANIEEYIERQPNTSAGRNGMNWPTECASWPHRSHHWQIAAVARTADGGVCAEGGTCMSGYCDAGTCQSSASSNCGNGAVDPGETCDDATDGYCDMSQCQRADAVAFSGPSFTGTKTYLWARPSASHSLGFTQFATRWTLTPLEMHHQSLAVRAGNQLEIQYVGSCIADPVTPVYGKTDIRLSQHPLDASNLYGEFVANPLGAAGTGIPDLEMYMGAQPFTVRGPGGVYWGDTWEGWERTWNLRVAPTTFE